MNTALVPMLISKASPTLSRFVGRKTLVAKKNAPHIFFTAGIIGSVTSTVLACRATLRLSGELDIIQGELTDARNNPTADVDRSVARAYLAGGLRLGRLYGPSAGVAVLSYSLLAGSHINLTRRNTALMAAYAAAQKAYDDYRQRVIAELGEEKELDIYHAVVDTKETEDGSIKVVDPNSMSPYARFFDEASSDFEKNPEYNRLFLTCQQNYANELLRARGHIFLNEVYDSLGLERSQAGSVVGWVIGDAGDNYVDFGMFRAGNSDFVNGLEPRVLLDFNVDGVIYDKI